MELPYQKGSDKTIFISYAREDSEQAERLYKDLRSAGAKPWIDKEEILAGEDWKLAISKAIKNNRFFIPLFSSKSASKIGYVNKELKYALDVLDNYRESDIYIIPVRLDNCEIPFQRLEGIHHADLFPDWDRGIKQILRSIGIDIEQQKESRDIEEQWTMGLPDTQWKALLKNIYEKKCIPFIGAGVYKVQNKQGRGLIPLNKDIIDKLRENYQHRYPLEDLYELARSYAIDDSYQLARLAQFLAIEHAEGNEIDPKTLLSEMIKEIDTSTFSSESTSSPYDVLADLDLPIYVTTNYDHFLEEALTKSRRKKAERDFFRWSDEVTNYLNATGVSSVFDDGQYKPTEERPLVYHIHGDIDTPESMVLTEKDYFEFVINTNKKDEQDMYPSIIRKEIASSSLLFIGYTLEDINFRTLFQGFLTFLDSLGKKRKDSIAVQLPPQISRKGQARMQRYLEQYTRNMFPNVYVFWGDSSEFIGELDKRWKEFKKKNDEMKIQSSARM